MEINTLKDLLGTIAYTLLLFHYYKTISFIYIIIFTMVFLIIIFYNKGIIKKRIKKYFEKRNDKKFNFKINKKFEKWNENSEYFIYKNNEKDDILFAFKLNGYKVLNNSLIRICKYCKKSMLENRNWGNNKRNYMCKNCWNKINDGKELILEQIKTDPLFEQEIREKINNIILKLI